MTTASPFWKDPDSRRWWWITGLWVGFFATWMVVTLIPSEWAISYVVLDWFRFLFGVAFAMLALYCVWKASAGEMWVRKGRLSSFAVNVMLFWIVMPPVWFFAEYHGFESGRLRIPAEFHGRSVTASQFMGIVSEYQSLASKMWAAVVTLLILTVTATKPDTEPKRTG